MNSTKLTRLEKIERALFAKPGEKPELTPKDVEIKARYEKAFTYWLQNPHLADRQIINHMVNRIGISKTQAQDDLRIIKRFLGNVTTASKEWYRHMVIEMAKQAYIMAKTKRDPKAMILAADKIGKYVKLDKDELESIPWERINPPNFEPSPDVAIINIEPRKDIERFRESLRRKYNAKYNPNITDAIIVDEIP